MTEPAMSLHEMSITVQDAIGEVARLRRREVQLENIIMMARAALTGDALAPLDRIDVAMRFLSHEGVPG